MKKVRFERNYADFLIRTGKGNYKLSGTPDEKFAVIEMPDADAIAHLRKGGNITEVIENNETTESEKEEQ